MSIDITKGRYACDAVKGMTSAAAKGTGAAARDLPPGFKSAGVA